MAIKSEAIQRELLEKAAQAQRDFWKALGELELATGAWEIPSTIDLTDQTLESLFFEDEDEDDE